MIFALPRINILSIFALLLPACGLDGKNTIDSGEATENTIESHSGSQELELKYGPHRGKPTSPHLVYLGIMKSTNNDVPRCIKRQDDGQFDTPPGSGRCFVSVFTGHISSDGSLSKLDHLFRRK